MASKSSGRPITRSESDIFLIGQSITSFVGTKLPSKKEVLQVLFHFKRNHEKLKDAATHTGELLIQVWEKARIPLKRHDHITEKILRLFSDWESLNKSQNKTSDSAVHKREEWTNSSDDLFDVAHADAEKIITIYEDLQFLHYQRQKGRPGRMSGVDSKLAGIEERAWIKEQKKLARQEKEAAERMSRGGRAVLSSSSSTGSEGKESGLEDQLTAIDFSFQEPLSSTSTNVPKQRRGRRNLIDDKLAAGLDLAKVSDRNAALVLTPTLQHLGVDPAEYNINRSSIRRERLKRRKSIAAGLKEEFNPQVMLLVHWDGKMMKDISGHESVERLPILVSGEGVEQLLAVPKLPSGTGVNVATAVFNVVERWQVSDQIKGMCFDTTASNTGRRQGACPLLEQYLDKDLLWVACRHHIFELVLEAVFNKVLGPSTGPEILLFRRFREQWGFIDKSTYFTFSSDEYVNGKIIEIADEMVNFCVRQMETFQPREDYKELLQLALLFLGYNPPIAFTFKRPAGLHRARWMSKLIYSLKIWMLRAQFKLTQKELKGLRDVVLFGICIYVKSWFTAPSAVDAPRNDLSLLKSIQTYMHFDKEIGGVALLKMLGHLWYLSEELIALAFFDDQVAAETKAQMVVALNGQGDEERLKRRTLEPETLQHKELPDFVTSNTLRFFTITGLSSEFLGLNVDHWQTNEGYLATQNTLRQMKVVNDLAERGVALIDEYNNLHTNDEEQKQYLLLVVSGYRKKYQDRNKSTLML